MLLNRFSADFKSLVGIVHFLVIFLWAWYVFLFAVTSEYEVMMETLVDQFFKEQN